MICPACGHVYSNTHSKLDPDDQMISVRSRSKHRERTRENARRWRARKKAKDPYALEASDAD